MLELYAFYFAFSCGLAYSIFVETTCSHGNKLTSLNALKKIILNNFQTNFIAI